MDPYDRARAEAMVIGYAATWDPVECEVLAVEREFRFPLVGHWHVGGKIDLIIRLADGRIATTDHKTSGEDVSAGSTYRERLILNGQATHYLWGSEHLGFEADLFLFDVLMKPRQKPYQITKSRKAAETPDEYRDRILADIAASPASYYAQIEINRTEAERGEYIRRIHDDVMLMDHVRDCTLQTPNENSCFSYSSKCEYWPVCSGTASLDDPTLYQLRTPAQRHSELEEPVPEGVQLMTNSRRQSLNACRRKHHYSYELGYRAHRSSPHAAFGTAIHLALQNYWEARMGSTSAVTHAAE
jgi:PD-(D/E)XK nuclease superfamily